MLRMLVYRLAVENCGWACEVGLRRLRKAFTGRLRSCYRGFNCQASCFAESPISSTSSLRAGKGPRVEASPGSNNGRRCIRRRDFAY